MMRQMAVAGQFYPAELGQLKELIARLVPEDAVAVDAIGALCPHAGYVYSGTVAAMTISRIKLGDTIIIMAPNHTGLGHPFSLYPEGSWQTPLGEITVDTELAAVLLENSSYLQADTAAHEYEHAIEVQLPFLQYLRPEIKIIPIVFAQASGDIFKEIGNELAKVIKEANKDITLLASSDMSHYETQEVANRKDNHAIEAILQLDETLLYNRIIKENITMCGFGPAISLISAAKRLGATAAELVKYQTSGDVLGDYNRVVGYAGIVIPGKIPSPLVRLARSTVELYVNKHQVYQPQHISGEMQGHAGVFVSIHKHDKLRGCIGTFEPSTENIAHEIVQNAISSASRDPRFNAITPEELPDLEFSVDVLTSPEPVDRPDELDPKKYGVIVESGYRRGLLLPALEGVDTVAQQIEICRLKAGIAPNEAVKLYRFEVKRHK